MFLPLFITLLALPHLPAQIPAHYGFNNQVDRWGSKYETLIFPAITILLGVILLAAAKYSAKQESEGENNENVCIITGIVCLILFNVMTCYFLYTDFNKVENLSEVSLDLNQISFAILGISLIIVGNIMPKIRQNSVIGLRTGWSMKNEVTWKKSQRFGGISSIIAGILIILLCLLTRGITCFLGSIGIILAMVIIDIYYTYQIAKKF